MGRKSIPILVATLWTAVAAAEPPDRIVDAAARQDMAAVRALIKGGTNVNVTQSDGATALLWASHWDDVATAELLLRARANVNAANDHGVTPLALATENVSIRMIDTLLEAGADPNVAQTSGLTPLMTAARTGSVPVVKALLGHGANVQAATHETKSTALMWAVSEQFPEVVRLLVDAQADVHASASNGFTPLLYAAQNGDIEIAKMLIAAGVSVNKVGSDGTHALPLAILRGQAAFALFLLDQGADPGAGFGGIRSLHAAAGRVDLWLREWNSNHPAAGQRGLTPASRLQLVQALLARGADPNVRTESTAQLMKYLGYPRRGAFEPYANGAGDLRGATPLMVAAISVSGSELPTSSCQLEHNGRVRTAGFQDIIRALLAGGADYRLTTEDGTTPLMAAAGLGGCKFTPYARRGFREANAEEAVKILVEAGADVNAINQADFTVLHAAAFGGQNEIVEYLVAHGANINARDFRGRTPFRVAEGTKQSFQYMAFPETAALLRRLGADTRLGIPGDIQERAAFYDQAAEPEARETVIGNQR